MTDPLGSGVLADGVADMKGLVTGSYIPVYITALLAAAAISTGLVWFGRGVSRFKKR